MSDIESPRFPDKIGYQSMLSSRFRTSVVLTASGRAYRNKDWPQSAKSYDLIHPVKELAEIEELYAFFESVAEGQANTFRFRDPFDNSITVANGLLSTGAGDGTPVYQIRKRRTAGAHNKDKDIKKPVVGTVVCYRNATPITVGVGAGNIAINTTNGEVTFVADDSEGITSHTPGASHVFTTAADISGLIIGMKVYLTGITGTAAATLNALAHTITNKTGAGPYTWTISTTTTGLTASSGTAAKYPQSTDVLTAACEFDIPVRMGRDDFPIRPVAHQIYVLDSLPLVEDKID